MRFRNNYLAVLMILAAFGMLQACNLKISWQDEATPVPAVPATLQIPLQTQTPFSPQLPTATPAVTVLPTPTLTLMFAPTPTATQQWTTCPGIVISQKDTDAGQIIHILRCQDGFEYDLDPLAKGTYAVGPNDKFLIYITHDGMVYGLRIGETRLVPLYNLKKEKIFSMINKGAEPDFLLSFSDGVPTYKLVITERFYGQKRMYDLPANLTH